MGPKLSSWVSDKRTHVSDLCLFQLRAVVEAKNYTEHDPEFMGSNPITCSAFSSSFVVLLFINLVSFIWSLKEVNLYLRGEKL